MSDDLKVCILYGSETGTAQDISERIGRQANYHGFSYCVMAMDEYPIIKLIEEKLAVFVCSTTGQGEEPGNMKHFWKFLLRKNLPSDCLSNLNVCVLGLGDSSYTKFNYAAKKLFKRLKQLGAKEILNVGLADDQHDLGADAVVDEWIKDLWSKIFQVFKPAADFQITDKIPIGEPKYKIEFLQKVQKAESNKIQRGSGLIKIFAGKVVSNVRVTADNHFQDVRLIKIDVVGSDMKYEPGDVASIHPSNLNENVEVFFDIFQKIHSESRMNVEQNNPNIPLPKVIIPELGDYFYPEADVDHVVLKDLVNHYFDIQSLPRRYFLELLENFTSSELEREKLQEFLSKDGQRDLYNYCHSARRSSLEVLRDFPNAAECVPLEYLFDLFPPIKPRSFSIASESPDQIELLIAVVNYKTKLLKPRLGLCSNWVSRLQVGDKVPICLKKGTFKFPSDFSVPLIMIGPGTGCAPFRGLLLRRQKLNLGNNFLFFGCRNRTGDFFFENEWNRMREAGLLQIFTAFSRDQDHKVYVQDVMMEQKCLLWSLINDQKAYVFLAGNAKDMPKEVKKTLISIFKTEGDMNDEKAEVYFRQLELQNKFQSETWS